MTIEVRLGQKAEKLPPPVPPKNPELEEAISDLRDFAYSQFRLGNPRACAALHRAADMLRSVAEDAVRWRDALASAHGVLLDAPELNMSNYDEDQVGQLNAAMVEAFLILDSAKVAGSDAIAVVKP